MLVPEAAAVAAAVFVAADRVRHQLLATLTRWCSRLVAQEGVCHCPPRMVDLQRRPSSEWPEEEEFANSIYLEFLRSSGQEELDDRGRHERHQASPYSELSDM